MEQSTHFYYFTPTYILSELTTIEKKALPVMRDTINGKVVASYQLPQIEKSLKLLSKMLADENPRCKKVEEIKANEHTYLGERAAHIIFGGVSFYGTECDFYGGLNPFQK